MSYINKVKYRLGIGLLTAFIYQYCGEKNDYNVIEKFAQ